MMLFIIISIVILIAYSALIFSFFMAWKRYPAFEINKNERYLFTSIIIPARNEEHRITELLSDLFDQDLDKSTFEILLVNDHSEDGTKKIAEGFKLKLNNLHVIDLKLPAYGKKQAIAHAVQKSKGKLIITIDADCRVGKNWLRTIVSFYCCFKPRLTVCPLLYYHENSFFGFFQSLDIMSMVASGAGALLLGKPILCNGANLAFTKDTYIRVSSMLRNNVVSGDDLFLMFAVKKLWPGDIKFLKSPSAASYTSPEPGIKSFLQQRKRWTSKFKHYSDRDIINISVIVFAANLAICASLIMIFFIQKTILLFFILLLLKSVADILLLKSFAIFFKKQHILKYFWIAQFIYPLYFVFISIYGNIGKFSWKNRIYN